MNNVTANELIKIVKEKSIEKGITKATIKAPMKLPKNKSKTVITNIPPSKRFFSTYKLL